LSTVNIQHISIILPEYSVTTQNAVFMKTKLEYLQLTTLVFQNRCKSSRWYSIHYWIRIQNRWNRRRQRDVQSTLGHMDQFCCHRV